MLPFSLLRCGTSRGPFITLSDLRASATQQFPKSRDCSRSDGLVPGLSGAEIEVALDLVGSGQSGQLEGIGGNSAITNKVYIVAPRSEDSCECWFLQCKVRERGIDASHGDCGNMLAGVGIFALDRGLVMRSKVRDIRNEGFSTIKVFANATGNQYEVDVPTNQDGFPVLSGNYAIAGVPSKGAPIAVRSLSKGGHKTGSLWPCGLTTILTGIDGNPIEASCIDAERPMVILEASSVGMTCLETKEMLDANKLLMANLESLRLQGGTAMGLGDCTGKVSPKLCVIAEDPENLDSLQTRYFVAPFEHDTHPTLAMTAAQALAVAALSPGSIPYKLMIHSSKEYSDSCDVNLNFHHPLGTVDIDVALDKPTQTSEYSPFVLQDGSNIIGTSYKRTVRRLVNGQFFVLDL